MNLKLTREERKAIFAGDDRALRRRQKPDVRPGDKIVLSWSRGGKHFVGRSRKEREETSGATVQVPRRPTIWIDMGETTSRIEPDPDTGLDRTVWLTQISIHDERERVRTLSAPPSPPREAGLKTRWRPPGQVPPRGAQVDTLTDESARGYGGGGKGTVDEREGVDDTTLAEYARQAEEETIKAQKKRREEARTAQLRGRLAEVRSRGMTRAEHRIQTELKKRAESTSDGA
jgi:hypothetical protein